MSPQEWLESAVSKVQPKYIIGLFSGGHDSATATHLASQHPRFSFALKIETGIGIEATNSYVRETCRIWGIELRECKASEYVMRDGRPDPQVYEEIVLKYGFPGPAGHGFMYNRLKEKALRKCIRDLNTREPILMVSGCRKAESKRRMANTKPLQKWEGKKFFAAPIWEMEKEDVHGYMTAHQIARNPVVDLIHKSGECLCGAFAQKGELAELRLWFPEKAAEIDALEVRARALGFYWGWEDEPPETYLMEKNHGQKALEGILCSSCVSPVAA